MARRPGSTLLLALLANACGGTPTQPAYESKPVSPLLFLPICMPVQADIRCTVQYFDTHSAPPTLDVTELGVWSVSSEPDKQVDTDVAAVSRPGVVVPRGKGNIYIRVTYAGLQQSAGPSYAIDPAGPAVPLAPYLEGLVTEARTDSSIFLGPGIPEALVEIVDPPSEVGRTYLTDTVGFYRFKHLPLDVPITVRASKAGYVTSIKTNSGITIQPSFGQALNTGLGFELAHVQQ
jgi:hypothetical protein